MLRFTADDAEREIAALAGCNAQHGSIIFARACKPQQVGMTLTGKSSNSHTPYKYSGVHLRSLLD